MFWADRIADEIEERFGKKRAVLIRDEKTPSGRVHVGSMRGVAIHGVISEVLGERGVPNTFTYEFNDFDPMDGFPEYLPEEFRQYMGLPLLRIPSPDAKEKNSAENFAEYFAEEFKDVIRAAGFTPEFYKVSELYLSGKLDECIRIALDRAADIRRIYKEVSGSLKPADWYPLAVFCEQCGKVATTRVFAWDGAKVSYRCVPDAVAWAAGCGHEGSISPFGGNAKFPFKVEWPAKWKTLGVMVEGAGKDHSTKGGARDVAAHIATEVFAYEAPLNVPYEFFLVGGKKMSSSKGRGSSAKEISALMPAKIFRLALLGKDINQAFNFDPAGDTIPALYDQYDTLSERYRATTDDDYARLFTCIHPGHQVPDAAFAMRFSQVAFLAQMPHMNLADEAAKIKGEPLSPGELAELNERAEYARRWLGRYAPEKFVFKLQERFPAAARNLSAVQKQAMAALGTYVESNPNASGEDVHRRLHAIKEEFGIAPAELFSAIYRLFLGRPQGPKAGWFLSVLPRDFVLRRLAEAAI